MRAESVDLISRGEEDYKWQEHCNHVAIALLDKSHPIAKAVLDQKYLVAPAVLDSFDLVC